MNDRNMTVKDIYSRGDFALEIPRKYDRHMDSLRLLRKAKGWNQETLAAASGLEQSYISKVENGWDGVTLRNLQNIADALTVPLYQLFLEDTAAAEITLLRTYRALPEERKRGWQDMALAAKADVESTDQ